MDHTARLGIDLGSSHTVAMLAMDGGPARPILVDGSPLLPSAVYAEPDGRFSVGRDALAQARFDPTRLEPNPKRRIDESTVLLGEREVPVAELLAATLRRVAGETVRVAGTLPAAVTLTCPAGWGAARRQVLRAAAESAGLGQVAIVDEPVAAATYFAGHSAGQLPPGAAVVVYDFGAGTFDASVVVRTHAGFEVRASDGRTDLGGLDLDALLVAEVRAAVGVTDDLWARLDSPANPEERRARLQFWDDIRAAKERLSQHPTASVHVPLVGADTHLTREQFESAARPLLESTVRVTAGVIAWAGLQRAQIAAVFLVGGASRVPLVATLLHGALEIAPTVLAQPELVVAEGATMTGPLPPAFVPTPAAPVSIPPVSVPPLSPPAPPAPGFAARPTADPGPYPLSPPLPTGPFGPPAPVAPVAPVAPFGSPGPGGAASPWPGGGVPVGRPPAGWVPAPPATPAPLVPPAWPTTVRVDAAAPSPPRLLGAYGAASGTAALLALIVALSYPRVVNAAYYSHSWGFLYQFLFGMRGWWEYVAPLLAGIAVAGAVLRAPRHRWVGYAGFAGLALLLGVVTQLVYLTAAGWIPATFLDAWSLAMVTCAWIRLRGRPPGRWGWGLLTVPIYLVVAMPLMITGLASPMVWTSYADGRALWPVLLCVVAVVVPASLAVLPRRPARGGPWPPSHGNGLAGPRTLAP